MSQFQCQNALPKPNKYSSLLGVDGFDNKQFSVCQCQRWKGDCHLTHLHSLTCRSLSDTQGSDSGTHGHSGQAWWWQNYRMDNPPGLESLPAVPPPLEASAKPKKKRSFLIKYIKEVKKTKKNTYKHAFCTLEQSWAIKKKDQVLRVLVATVKIRWNSWHPV